MIPSKSYYVPEASTELELLSKLPCYNLSIEPSNERPNPTFFEVLGYMVNGCALTILIAHQNEGDPGIRAIERKGAIYLCGGKIDKPTVTQKENSIITTCAPRRLSVINLTLPDEKALVWERLPAFYVHAPSSWLTRLIESIKCWIAGKENPRHPTMKDAIKVRGELDAMVIPPRDSSVFDNSNVLLPQSWFAPN